MILRLHTLRRHLPWWLVIAGLLAGTVIFSARRAEHQLRSDLLHEASLIARSLNPDLVGVLTGTAADAGTPAYHRLKEQLAALRAADPKYRFLYLIGRQATGPVMFLVDAEPDTSPDFSPPGQVYDEATPRLLETIALGRADVEGPVRDRWGTWVSAMVPVALPGHGLRILLGLDVDAHNWKRVVGAHALFPASLVSIAILLGFLAAGLNQSRRALRLHQAELQASESRFAELAEQSRTIIWEVDAAGLYTFVSPVVAQVLGFRPDELICRKHFYDLHPEPGREEFRQAAFRFFDRKEAFVDFENPIATKDGRELRMLTNGLPLLNADGSLRGYRGSDQDITTRRQAEKSLRSSEEKLAALFMSMDEMVVLHELLCDDQGVPVNYRLTDCNTAFTRVTGISRERAIGRLATEVYGTPAAPYLKEYAQVVGTSTPLRFETFYEPMKKHFQISAVALGADRFATVSTDITEQQQSADKVRALLEESNRARRALLGILEDQNRAQADLKRLATALEQSAESIVVTDAQARIQYVNPAFVKTTGYSREEALGQNPRILQSGRHPPAFYHDMWHLLSSGRTWQGRLINRRKNGTLYTEDAVISPVADGSGRVTNFVAVKHDITEQLQLADQLQQSQKLDSIGRLAGGVAHDFNNMLTIILGHAGMALGKLPAGNPVLTHLEEIRNAANRSAELTRQLLAFARRQTITPQILDLNQTIAGLLKMLKRLIGENILLHWHPARELWPVRLDPAQIDQILVNLCVNARDAITGPGEITLATECVTLDAAAGRGRTEAVPGEYVRIAVRDTGCGMDPQTLSRIFEPFFTTKEFGAGTGLGLATVYGIVRQNNGFIDVASTPGQGSVFTIHLPRHVEAADAGPRDSATVPGGTESILLVEDDYGILQIASQMLRNLGYAVTAMESPARALQMAAEPSAKFDLVITDVVMPGMNGRALADRVLARWPGIRILFISGYSADIIARNGILEDGVFFIPKPFSPRALAIKVREVLDAQRPAAPASQPAAHR